MTGDREFWKDKLFIKWDDFFVYLYETNKQKKTQMPLNVNWMCSAPQSCCISPMLALYRWFEVQEETGAASRCMRWAEWRRQQAYRIIRFLYWMRIMWLEDEKWERIRFCLLWANGMRGMALGSVLARQLVCAMSRRSVDYTEPSCQNYIRRLIEGLETEAELLSQHWQRGRAWLQTDRKISRIGLHTKIPLSLN